MLGLFTTTIHLTPIHQVSPLYCRMPPAYRCPQRRQRVTEGTVITTDCCCHDAVPSAYKLYTTQLRTSRVLIGTRRLYVRRHLAALVSKINRTRIAHESRSTILRFDSNIASFCTAFLALNEGVLCPVHTADAVPTTSTVSSNV